MAGEIGCCGQVVRVVFIILNGALMVIGVTMLSTGVYSLINDPIPNGQNAELLAGGIIALGVLTTATATLGIFTAIGLWWPVLTIYATVMTIIVVLEIMSGSLVLGFKDNLVDRYVENFETNIEGYRQDTASDYDQEVNKFVDDAQTRFLCCGTDGSSSWLNTTYYQATRTVPSSCSCTTDCDQMGYYKMGCSEALPSSLNNFTVIFGSLILSVGVLKAIVVTLSCSLCCFVFVHRNDDYY